MRSPQRRTGRAVLIIAQRVSTVQHADQIVVLSDGQVAGIGKHDELMADCEVYREIVESQTKEPAMGEEGVTRMTTQNDDMTETVVNAGDTVKTDDIELEAPKNAMAHSPAAVRAAGQSAGCACAWSPASILLFTFFHIAAPMYSAVVVDSIWDAVQGAWA